MPEYLFRCESCEDSYSIICSMSEIEKHKKCIKCKSRKIYREYDREIGKGGAQVHKTLGAYLDKVSANMSAEEKQKIMEKARQE